MSIALPRSSADVLALAESRIGTEKVTRLRPRAERVRERSPTSERSENEESPI